MEKICAKYYNHIPKTLTVNGKKYKLRTWYAKKGEICSEWYFMTYDPINTSDGNNMPPEWKGKRGTYYLCVADLTKEEAEQRMLEKLNGEW